MSAVANDYLLINGAKYRIAPNKFARSQQSIEPAQVTGKRVQSPYFDLELVGFENGDQANTYDDNGVQAGTLFGWEPTAAIPPGQGHLAIKVGRQLEAQATASGSKGFIAACSANGYLWLLPQNQHLLYRWDGASLTSYDYGAITTIAPNNIVSGANLAGQTALVLANDYLVFGAGSHVLIYDIGGAAFHDQGSLGTGNAAIIGISGANALVWALAVTLNNQTLLRTLPVSSLSTGAAPSWTTAHTVNGTSALLGMIVGSTAYAAIGSEGASGSGTFLSRLYSCPADGSGSVTQILELLDNFPVSMASFDGQLAVGMAWGGSVRTLSGGQLKEILHVGSLSGGGVGPASDAVYALLAFNNELYAAGYDSSQSSGHRSWLRRYTGQGWFTITTGGNGSENGVGCLGRHGGTMLLGDLELTDGELYQHSTSDRLTSATLVAPRAVAGAPTLPKSFLSTTLTHSALLAGQAVQAQYAVDGGGVVTLGTNYRVGSTATAFRVPGGVRGRALQPSWVVTNGAAQDFTAYSCSARMIPSPPANAQWDATLLLHPAPGNAFADASSDTLDADTKYGVLAALRSLGAPFPVVAPLKSGSSLTVAAMTAIFDPQTPLQTQTNQRADGIEITLPIRLLQAQQPQNLLLNGSFEQNTGNGTAPTSWATFGTGTSALVDTAKAADQTYSLKLIFDGSHATYGIEQDVSAVIAAAGAGVYSLSAQAWRTTSGSASYYAELYDDTASVTYQPVQLASFTDAGWVAYGGSFLVPASAIGHTFHVRLYGTATGGNPSGSMWWDAIQLEYGAPYSSFREQGDGS